MEPIEIIAQIMGIFGMIFISSSYQMKSQRRLIIFQLFGAGFFFVNFLLLGIAAGVLLTGAVMNLLGVARSFVFSNRKKFHAENPAWLIVFVSLYIIAYILVFTVFGTKPTFKNFAVELLPVIGMTSTTFAFFSKKSGVSRKLGLINSPAWLVYDIINFSIGGIITEVLSLTSIVIGMMRHDRKGKDGTSIAER